MFVVRLFWCEDGFWGGVCFVNVVCFVFGGDILVEGRGGFVEICWMLVGILFGGGGLWIWYGGGGGGLRLVVCGVMGFFEMFVGDISDGKRDEKWVD